MRTSKGHDSGMRVLIVDDNVETARLMKALLDRSGFDARTAYDGEEALRVAGELLPIAAHWLDMAGDYQGGRLAKLRRDPGGHPGNARAGAGEVVPDHPGNPRAARARRAWHGGRLHDLRAGVALLPCDDRLGADARV